MSIILTSGCVTEVIERNYYKVDILHLNGGQTISTYINFDILLDVSDVFVGQIQEKEFNIKLGVTKKTKKVKGYTFVNPPFVEFCHKREDIFEYISMYYYPNKEAGKFIWCISQMFDELSSDFLYSGLSFSDFLDKLTENYFYKKIIHTLPTNDNTKISKKMFDSYMKFWKFKRLHRKLYILGLYESTIINSDLLPIELYKRLIENPYNVYDITIESADSIIQRQSKEISENNRMVGMLIRYINEKRTKSGWTCIKVNEYIKTNFKNSLRLVTENPDQYYLRTKVDGNDTFIYLQYLYNVEYELSRSLNKIKSIGASYQYYDSWLSQMNSSIKYTDEQKEAIQGALHNSISLITGLPGCGKSTVINAIVSILKQQNVRVQVAGFTGKCIARIKNIITTNDQENTEKKQIKPKSKLSSLLMTDKERISEEKSEVDSLTPMTLDMMLVKKNTIGKFDVLILDEVSMISVDKLYKILVNFDVKMLIMTGDYNQLDSIGLGNLMETLLKHDIPNYKLTKNYRVENDLQENKEIPAILKNPENIIKYKEKKIDKLELFEDDTFLKVTGDLKLLREYVEMFKDNGFDPYSIKVLCPLNEHVNKINNMYREVFEYNKNAGIVDSYDNKFHIGERVMMTKNNNVFSIFNGDEGIVSSIIGTGINVRYGNREIMYPIKPPSDEKSENKKPDYELAGADMDDNLTSKQLKLSNCITVHKSQGSEYPIVIYYIPKSEFVTCNLSFTAITRAKQMVVIIEEEEQLFEKSLTKHPRKKVQNLSQHLIEFGFPLINQNSDDFDNECDYDDDFDNDIPDGYE